MTMLETLFGLIPAGSRGQQWLAGELQLVNWGGYDGHHRVRFSPTATLLVGGSGTGKSTLMDAYIALMMPHTTPFNGASNGGVTGRPRGEDQRNILSYSRGKIDETRTDDGTKVRVLRGDGEDTWTAVSMTWIDHDGSRFTAVRAWYVPATARVLEEAVRVRATVDGAFDLAALEEAAARRFSDTALRAAGLDPVATDREFSARLHAVLGIGAAGAGAKAMSLLARIQAGQQITTVDDLYKRMVLEEPETLVTADAVVAHFDELDATRTRMLVARAQVDAIAPIRGLRERIRAAAERERLIDEVGDVSDASSLAALWRARRRLDLLRDVEGELGRRTREIDAVRREKQALADAADAERDGLVEVLRNAGGDRLETAQRELRDAERRLAAAERRREIFDADVASLGASAATREEFDALAGAARRALADRDARGAAREAFVDAAAERTAARSALGEIDAEMRASQGATGAIPSHLDRARRELADAAGLAPDDLPFVAELVEVRTEFEPWREAFGLALGGFATTLLVDAERLPAFRAAIEGVRTGERLRYEGVETGIPAPAPADARTLPGRLDFRETPFTGWLRQRLDDRYAFVCVDSAAEFGRHRRALTIGGQVSEGSRGSHGGHGRRSVLGFSAGRRQRELERARFEAEARLRDAELGVETAERALDEVDARRSAFEKIADVTWDQVDTASAEADRERWTALAQEVAADSPEIAGLQRQIDDARARSERLRAEVARAAVEAEQIGTRWGDVVDDVDASQAVIDDAERAERALTAAQTAYLDERFVYEEHDEPSPAAALDRFDAALQTATHRLLEDRRAAVEAHGEQRESMRRLMQGFLARWPNPNLLADPDASVGDFERILEALETSGLHELEAEWRESLLNLSGNDLANLDGSLSRAMREIRERIDPINRIMQDLPFADEASRLQIVTREAQSEGRRRFRRELRDVRAAIEAAESDGDRERVYERMAKLISRFRREAPDFADLVDVRQHVRVSAERVDAVTKAHQALYDHIGEKSGGESQELIAFIVGAALRYQLGDAGAERPRYAPVFMDEALIKADAHFTKRAIGAWRGLGFQLVIGAPNDKYSAIEPHVDVEYDIVKDTKGRSWAKPKVGLD
ncbi:ATP-binding protein [Microbacterium indicum]|uniref:ATP-binding protein n=1 Tax=Microbacterium indicum TaxID=358100 RepID=UPI00041B1728|nr:SbcC/MukB-like Walker B domain-containing protein [Microbacterium indicum]